MSLDVALGQDGMERVRHKERRGNCRKRLNVIIACGRSDHELEDCSRDGLYVTSVCTPSGQNRCGEMETDGGQEGRSGDRGGGDRERSDLSFEL